MSHPQSSCPLCGAHGRAAEPCANDVCRRRRFHFVPDEFLDNADDALDGLVGQRWQDVLLVRRLGAGGVGAIYLALQMPLQMKVAVKFLTRDAPPKLAERLQDEARALARLHHHNIVRLLKYGQMGRHTFLVMEFVGGGRTLADAMERENLDRPARVRILRQLIEALEAAHTLNVVHRDVKPENIMLQRTPRDPNFVKLVDFGLAKFTDGGRESTQLAAGTPTYMAPEQITRRNIGPWTDWYAVAMIALELLLDHRPYAHMATDEVVRAKMGADCDPTRGLTEQGLAPAVTRFFHLALATDPHNRLRAAKHFRDHFNGMVDALPAPAVPLEPTLHGELPGAGSLAAMLADLPDPEARPLPRAGAPSPFREVVTVREREPEPTQEHVDRRGTPTSPSASQPLDESEIPTGQLPALPDDIADSAAGGVAPGAGPPAGPRLVGSLPPAAAREQAARGPTIHLENDAGQAIGHLVADRPTNDRALVEPTMRRPRPAPPGIPFRDVPTQLSSAGRRAPLPPGPAAGRATPADIDSRPTHLSSPGRRMTPPQRRQAAADIDARPTHVASSRPAPAADIDSRPTHVARRGVPRQPADVEARPTTVSNRRAAPPPAPPPPPPATPRRTRPALPAPPTPVAMPGPPPPPAVPGIRRTSIEQKRIVPPARPASRPAAAPAPRRPTGPISRGPDIFDSPPGADGTRIVATRARWKSVVLILLLVGLGVLAAMIWLLLNPPAPSPRADLERPTLHAPATVESSLRHHLQRNA